MKPLSGTGLPAITLIASLVFVSAVSCGHRKQSSRQEENNKACDTAAILTPERRYCNSVYHWKTTFNLNRDELAFLRKHKIHRLYLRMFDVDVDSSPMNEYDGAVPIGTTSFKGPKPDSVEIVPTVFITTKAIASLGRYKDNPRSLAQKIYTRIQNMVSNNELGPIHEIQLDCDWTSSTQGAFYEVCKETKALAGKDSVVVSSTIRLHQLRLDPPPVDRGVLMVYNTGAIRQPGTKNSILEVADVKSYLARNVADYKLPLDFAYPAFGWGVLFRGSLYQGILHHTDFSDTKYYADKGDGTFHVKKNHFLEGHFLRSSDVIRLEYPPADVVKSVARMVTSKFKDHPHSTILYHLDSQNLSNFTADEITDIYSH